MTVDDHRQPAFDDLRAAHLVGERGRCATQVAIDATGTWVRREDLARTSGWEGTADGWCLGPVCVPADGADQPWTSLDRLAQGSGVPVASWSDDAEAVIVIGRRPEEGTGALDDGQAPSVVLTTLEGAPCGLDSFSGRRRLLLFFASWCGCRYDLPAWEERYRQMLAVDPTAALVAIALDRSAADVAPWTEGVTFPVLLDADRAAADAYGILNVPTVLWIDATDALVRDHEQIFGDNRFTEHHGVDSEPHHRAVLRWLETGEVDRPRSGPLPAHLRTDAAHQQARAGFRLGLELLELGRREAAGRAFDEAGAQAPDDLSIRRAALQLLGEDPFGEAFVALYQDWAERTGGLSYRPQT